MITRESVPEARLRELAAQATGGKHGDFGSWDIQSLHYDASSPASLGLYRVSGTARGAGYDKWSLILKAIRSPGGVEIAPGVVLPLWVDDLPPTEFGYWQREVLIYRSGMLERLPGAVAAPHCYAVDEVAPKVYWLWLEDVAETENTQWSLSRCAETAQHLGQLNGSYLVGHPLPTEPWLQAGWLRSWLEPGRPGAAWEGILPSAWDHPIIARAFPPSSRERLARLWDERHRMLHALDALPRCFCHRDAWPPNLLMRNRRDGRRETVALDWAFAGIGPVGEEIAPLIAWTEVPDVDLQDIENAVFPAYLAGLRDAGWDGDADLVWWGYAATAVLRYSFVCTLVSVRAAVHGRSMPSEASKGEDISERTVRQNARIVRFLLDLADTVRVRLA